METHISRCHLGLGSLLLNALVLLIVTTTAASAYPATASRYFAIESTPGGGCDIKAKAAASGTVISASTEAWFCYSGGIHGAAEVSTLVEISGPGVATPILSYNDSAECGGCQNLGAYAQRFPAAPGNYTIRHRVRVSLWAPDTWANYPSDCAIIDTVPYSRLSCEFYLHVTNIV